MNYEGKCRRLHGHNGVVEICLQNHALDPHGMVCDFGEVKRKALEYIDTYLDHRTLLRADDPLIDLLRNAGESPFVMKENPTAENIAKLIFEELYKQKFPVISIKLWETEHAWAEYRP